MLRALYLNVDYFGGALGLSGIPERAETWMIYGLLGLADRWRSGWSARSRIGRAMEAMREDETAAAVMGVPVPALQDGRAARRPRCWPGSPGCLSAHVSSFIGPNEYGFEPAVTILSFALLGGIGTPFAPVLGAWVLTLLPELLRGFSDVRLVLNGLIIVVAVLFLPERAARPCACAGARRERAAAPSRA